MTYWHMQLHPDDKNWGKEQELLNDLSLIGIGDYWEGGKSQIDNFKKDMKVNDIVLIRSGETPIALVEVVGELEDILDNDFTRLDWFRYRRKVNVLDFANDKQQPFPQPRGTLQKLINKTTDSYRYIESWYQKISTLKYTKHLTQEINLNQYKIQKVYISNLKMFNKFILNLADKNGIPLPLVVIAGKNGTGKTTILDYLSDYNLQEDDFIEIFETHKPHGMEDFFEYEKDVVVDIFRLSKSMSGILEKKAEYKNSVIYIPVGVNDLGDLEEKIADYYITKAEELDSFKEALQNVQRYLKDIFDGLDLSFNISKIDYKEKKVFLSNHLNQEFQIGSMSTGEKTLMSKVLYLYFQDIKNKIILIDEPELSLHPAWQNRVLKLYENFAKENNCQIIIATHSPHIIGSAKNEYIRILTEDGVINDVTAYGRDIEWVLEEVMGANYTREKSILDKFDEIQELINDNKLNEAEENINALENIIGLHDKEILKLRNDLAFQRMDFEEDK